MSTDPNAYDSDNAESSWEAEEKSLSTGNTRLAIIVGAIVLLGGFGYAMMPNGKASNGTSTSMMGSVMLDGEATVTGAAAKPEAAPATEEEEAEAKKEEATKATKTVAATPAVAAKRSAAPATSASIAPIAATSVSAPADAAPAPAPVVAEAPATTNLTGRVLDEEGQPLAGATIFLKGSRKIASADANGNYTIEVPVGENILTYGYGGYQDQVMRVRTGQSGNVTLLPKEGTRRRKH